MPCRNSLDPSCGEFHWDPAPSPNAPILIEVTPTINPESGSVALTGFARDDDARISEYCLAISWGDGSRDDGGLCPIPHCQAAYGPWDPPPTRPSQVPIAAEHTYKGPGDYEIRVTARSDSLACRSPYASEATQTLVVRVPS